MYFFLPYLILYFSVMQYTITNYINSKYVTYSLHMHFCVIKINNKLLENMSVATHGTVTQFKSIRRSIFKLEHHCGVAIEQATRIKLKPFVIPAGSLNAGQSGGFGDSTVCVEHSNSRIIQIIRLGIWTTEAKRRSAY